MHTLARFHSAAALALALATAASAANQVFVVDDVAGPGVDFTNLQSAINAAAEGDVILIRSGTYAASGGLVPTFQISAKSLTLVADGAAIANFGSPLAVGSLAAGQQVALRGLRIDVTDSGTALILSNNAGSVWVEDCSLTSASFSFPFAPPGHGVNASSCSSVVLARCTLKGSSIPFSSPGYHGYIGTNSNVCFYDCTLAGGKGGAGSPLLEGGDGANLAGGFLFASGSSFTGGQGGKGEDGAHLAPCSNGASGGDGLHLASGAPAASTIACTFTPGPGGPPGNPVLLPCVPGAPGLGIRVTAGAHTPLAGAAHHLNATATVREGQTLFKTYGGPAGELVFADYGGFQGFTYFEAFRGVLVLSLLQPFFTVFEGTMPAGGTLTKTVTINPLAPGTEGVTIYLQAGFYNFTTGIFQGAPSLTVLLDSAF